MLRVLLGSLMGALCIGLATAGSCDAPIQLSTALSLVNVMQQLTTKIDNLKTVTEAKFKDILTPDTGTAPTLSNTAGLSFQPVTFTLGVKCWTDRADYKYTQAPAYLNGATLFSGPHKSITKGTTFTVTLSAPGTIYLFFENSGRSGGYEQQLLGTGKWVKTADIIKWGGGCCKGTMHLLKHDNSKGTFTLGSTTSDQTVFGVAVKYDKGIYARLKALEDKTSSSCVDSKKNGDEMGVDCGGSCKACGASAFSNTGGISYTPVTYYDGIKCWNDRSDYKYSNGPDRLIGATLFRGPHKSVPSGTTFTVTMYQPGTIYLFFEVGSRGGNFENTLLGTKAWKKHPTQMDWGGGCCKGKMDILYHHEAMGTFTFGPTSGTQTVFGATVKYD